MVDLEPWLVVCNRVAEKIDGMDPLILPYATDLYGRIQTLEGQTKYIKGLWTMSLLTSDRFYKYLTAATLIAATNKSGNTDIIEKVNFNSPEIVDNNPLTILRASELVAKENSEGKIVGLLHGHYRLLTPGSLLNIVLAGEQCDSLYLGMERKWRTRTYKKVETRYFDRQRENIMILFPGLASHVVEIKRLSYTNEGYRRMVKKISPSIYFGSESNPQEVRQEMALRAELSGAMYQELRYIPSFSTSEYLGVGGKTEVDFSPLFNYK